MHNGKSRTADDVPKTKTGRRCHLVPHASEELVHIQSNKGPIRVLFVNIVKMTQERGAVERQRCAVPNIGLQDTYLCLLLGPKCAQSSCSLLWMLHTVPDSNMYSFQGLLIVIVKFQYTIQIWVVYSFCYLFFVLCHFQKVTIILLLLFWT